MPNRKNYVSPEGYKVIKAHWDIAAKQSYAFYKTWSSFQYIKIVSGSPGNWNCVIDVLVMNISKNW